MRAEPSLDKNWEQAQLLYLQGTPTTEIAVILGCKRGTLDSRISRAGLPAIREQQRKIGRGLRTKDKIAAVAEDVVDRLSDHTPHSAQALNRHADTLAKVAKTASLVHGWSEGSAVPCIVWGDLVGRAEPEEAIEIEDVLSDAT